MTARVTRTSFFLSVTLGLAGTSGLTSLSACGSSSDDAASDAGAIGSGSHLDSGAGSSGDAASGTTSDASSSSTGDSGGGGTIDAGPSAPITLGGTIWYVRKDGGTRFSANQPMGQCDGKADVAYPGIGTNQHCAFDDPRLLWDDHSYGKVAWVIAGGDSVVLRDGPWRIGFEQAATANDVWCQGGGGAAYCTMPPVPSGTAAQPTHIVGESYASCSAASAKTQLHGGWGLEQVISLNGSSFVDVACLELTDYSQCLKVGNPQTLGACNGGYGAKTDDYGDMGVFTDATTHDVLLQDLDIHGFAYHGIYGNLGGLIDVNHVRIAGNASDGWNTDTGGAAPQNATNAAIAATALTIEWNGCDEEYPLKDAKPYAACYDDASEGYGDGLGTANPDYLSFACDQCTVQYNTQDGIDLGHVAIGTNTLNVTRSAFAANMGAAIKWGANETTATATDNVVLGNCARMAEAIPGAPGGYNKYLTDWCRAGDTWSFNLLAGGTALLANNTTVSYSGQLYDIQCDDSAGCATAKLTVQNNLNIGYSDHYVTAMYNGNSLPAANLGSGVGGAFTSDHNLFYGYRDVTCAAGSASSCSDPKLTGEPVDTEPLPSEALLDAIDFTLQNGSPAKGAGVVLPSVTTTYDGSKVASPPDIGAY